MRGLSAARHILMTADAVGGVWTHALDLAAGLEKLGTRTTLVVLGPAPDAAQRADALGVPGLQLVESGLPLDWLAAEEREVRRAGQALAQISAASGADLVQLNSPALAAGGAFGMPVVGVCHSCVATWWQAVRGGAMPAEFVWRTDLLARGYAACDALVAPSHAFAAATEAVYSQRPEVVWNGRAGGDVADGMTRFAFTAGRLWDEGKDAATLDRAASRLDVPIMAAGPTRGPNGATVALPNLRQLGSLSADAVRAWMARGPIFVSAARYEPFGLAVLEAAAAGCALVLSDIPTFRELWDGAAVFVAPGDDAGFAAAIARLSRNREQRSCLRVAARERAGRHSVKAMASGMAAVHAQLLHGRTAREERSVAA